MSISQTGIKRKPHKRKGFSKDHICKLKAARKRWKLSDESRRKISKTLQGHGVSDESRRKMSEKKKGIKHSDEWKKKQAEAIKLWWSKRK